MKKFLLVLITVILSLTASYSQEYNQEIDALIKQINLDSLKLTLKELTGEKLCYVNGELITIYRKNKPSNASATDYLEQKLVEYGYSPDKQYCDDEKTKVINVIAQKTGIKYPEGKIIFCAHYDSESSDSLAPGADDNASGCSIVLEAARLLKNYQSNYTILFCLWDGEEWGLIGSECFAKQAFENNEQIVAVINMDMIGYNYENMNLSRIFIDHTDNSIGLWQTTKKINNIYNFGLNIDSLITNFAGSDMQSFWKYGFPGFTIEEAVLNMAYHSAGDLLKLFDFEYYMKNARLATASLLHFDIDASTDINETLVISKDNPVISPSPFSNSFVINFEGMYNSSISIVSVINVMGTEVFSASFKSEKCLIDIAKQPQGIYFVKIIHEHKVFIRKIIKE